MAKGLLPRTVSEAMRSSDSLVPDQAELVDISTAPAHRSCVSAHFEPATVEIGRIPWCIEIPIATSFVNSTEVPVRIEAVKTSCGCTVLNHGDLAGLRLGCGERVEITGTLRVGTPIGEHYRRIDLMLDSGAVHSTDIHYEAYATYTVIPAAVEFGVVDLDGEDDLTVSVLFYSEEATLMAPPESDSSWLSAAALPRSGTETEIIVRLRRAVLPFGDGHAQLTLTTSDQFRPQFSIPVRLTTRAKLRAVPSRLVLAEHESAPVRLIRDDGSFSPIASWSADGAIEFLVSEDRSFANVRSLPGQPTPRTIEIRDVNGDRAALHVVQLE